MNTRHGAIALVLLVSILTAGCGAGESTATPIPPTITATPPATKPASLATASRSTPPPAQATLGDTISRPADAAIMVYVPAGAFQMGSTPEQSEAARELCDPFVEGGECPKALFGDESPQHAVTLGDFWIDQTEVTNAQYRLCLEAGVCQDGVVSVSVAEGGAGPGASLCFSPEAVSEDIEGCVATIRRQVGQRGGIQAIQAPQDQSTTRGKEHCA